MANVKIPVSWDVALRGEAKYKAWCQASATVSMRYSLFCDVTQHRLTLVTDVSGQDVGPIFKDPAIQEDCLTDRLSRNVGIYQSTSRNIWQRARISNKYQRFGGTYCLLLGGR